MKIIKEFVLRDIAGESILVPIGETVNEYNGMISLSESAKFIWQNLESSNSLDDLIAAILKEFDVTEDVARNETQEFLSALLKNKFIALTDSSKNW